MKSNFPNILEGKVVMEDIYFIQKLKTKLVLLQLLK